MTAIAAQTAADSGAAPQWINDLMDALGAPGAGLAIALENLFPPLPSEVILPLAGFAASSGRMNLIAVLLWTTAGSVIGALALYGVGALLGRDRTVAIAGKLPLVKVSDIEKTEVWFLKHGTKAVFFGRMIPIFRSLISRTGGCGADATARLPRSDHAGQRDLEHRVRPSRATRWGTTGPRSRHRLHVLEGDPRDRRPGAAGLHRHASDAAGGRPPQAGRGRDRGQGHTAAGR
ncbi:DedA family protein [Streptomyces thinghirensis]|nr:DedA family protein [Streptomyces thinghirensis]